MTDWQAVKAFYIETRSLKATAERFTIAVGTVKARAHREKWADSAPHGDCPPPSFVTGMQPAPEPVCGYASPDGLHTESGMQNADAGMQGMHSGMQMHTEPGMRVCTELGSGYAIPAPMHTGLEAGDPSGMQAHCEPGMHLDPGMQPGGSVPPDAGMQSGEADSPQRPFPSVMPATHREAALLYRSLGLAVYPCLGPNEGSAKERGKKPRLNGWTQWTPGDLTDALVDRYFGLDATKPSNIGCRIVPPLIAVDLDSKIDQGASVRQWLAGQAHLSHTPRERSGNGVHLWFVCRDLPAFTKKNGAPCEKPLFSQINGCVHAELFFTGNLILSPSVHPSGAVYTWELADTVPEVTWAQLQHWFGFENPNPAASNEDFEPGQRGRSKKEKPWQNAFRGDIASLEIVRLMETLGLYGRLVDADEGKHAVCCPWRSEHGTPDPDSERIGSDTVVYQGDRGKWPGFHCLHAHCAERGLRELLAWAETQKPGIVDECCTMLRGDFAADSLREIALESPWGGSATGIYDRLVKRYGDPFRYTMKEGEEVVVDFNPHYWAAQLAFETLLIFDPHSNLFYTYLPKRGIWRWQTDATIRNLISAYLLDYSRRLNQPILDLLRTGERLVFMLTILRGLTERREPFQRKQQVIHLLNGMLHLDCNPPVLREFSPNYYSLHQCAVAFDEQATCPRFLRNLAYYAMDPDDAALFQLVGGMYLLGRNTWQKLMILTGVGGAGKGTLMRIVSSIIGKENVKQLRTRLLTDRFELDNLDQCSLLVGSDVDGDFLSCRGAKVIKALTGGDPLTMETKGGRKRDIYGEHNILISCNDTLRVKLDGDESAWKRRLLIIEFTKPPAGPPIEDFDRLLMQEEGSGILNWFILGAVHLVALSEQRGRFPLTPRQEERIENLLSESDSLRMFVKRRVERVPNSALTVDDLHSAYENFCAELGWVALTKNQAEKQLGPLMMEFHRAAKRNDIRCGNAQKRGFMHVGLDQAACQDS